MDKLKQFRETIEREQTLTLATAEKGRVCMRAVSPVYYDGAILIFTSPASRKYRQLREEPACCVAAGEFFAEARAEFRGATMLAENAALRDAYRAKFAGAFAEGDEFGGRGDEFILLRPTRLSGWELQNGIPTAPFELELA